MERQEGDNTEVKKVGCLQGMQQNIIDIDKKCEKKKTDSLTQKGPNFEGTHHKERERDRES